MSVLVKVTGESGRVGWGETYGIVAPQAVKAIIDEVLGPVVIGRDPADAAVIHEDLYDLMRVRGFFGGYYVDASPASTSRSGTCSARLRTCRSAPCSADAGTTRLPAYVSGLPKATLKERCDLAVEWVGKGFKAIKFAAAMSDDGIVHEMAALREAVGPDIDIMVDLHWKFTAGEAIRLIRRLEAYNLYFAEAPCAPEDIEGQAQVARAIGGPLALGEEWRTVFEYRPRFEARAMSIIQPEMGHTGITEFHRIGRHGAGLPCGHDTACLDRLRHLHGGEPAGDRRPAEGALSRVPALDLRQEPRYMTGDMACGDGFYTVPTGPGLGVEPKDGRVQVHPGREREMSTARKRYQGIYPVLYALLRR